MRTACATHSRVEHRQHAGHGGIDQADVIVGRAAELGRGAGEELGPRGDLGMDLQADDDLPVAGRPADELRRVRGAEAHVHWQSRRFAKLQRISGGNCRVCPA